MAWNDLDKLGIMLDEIMFLDHMVAHDDLDLGSNPITKVPDYLLVHGNLFLNELGVTSIPSTAIVKGKVYVVLYT